MKFPKLCDICVKHEYYNAGTSERLKMQLVPSVESERWIKNHHILVRNNKNVFSIYGDVFEPKEKPEDEESIEKELKREFRLSFALTVSDPYFFDASDLRRPEEVDSGGTKTALRQDNSKTVYYFHNNRTDLIEGMACLSKAKHVSENDLVLLYPLTFAMEGLDEIFDLNLATVIPYIEDDEKPYEYFTMVDPEDRDNINRIFRVDLSPFGNGHYVFSYKKDKNGNEPVLADFCLNDEFYGLRPFAVIDLFFYKDMNTHYKPPNKVYHLFLPARKCWWRYHIISKFKKYENLKIMSVPNTPAVQFTEGEETILSNGETAMVFESSEERALKQVMETSLELRGTYVPTLGIEHNDDGDGDNETTAVESRIRRLPNPTIENLVLKESEESEESNGVKEYDYYCDMFVYI